MHASMRCMGCVRCQGFKHGVAGNKNMHTRANKRAHISHWTKLCARLGVRRGGERAASRAGPPQPPLRKELYMHSPPQRMLNYLCICACMPAHCLEPCVHSGNPEQPTPCSSQVLPTHHISIFTLPILTLNVPPHSCVPPSPQDGRTRPPRWLRRAPPPPPWCDLSLGTPRISSPPQIRGTPTPRGRARGVLLIQAPAGGPAAPPACGQGSSRWRPCVGSRRYRRRRQRRDGSYRPLAGRRGRRVRGQDLRRPGRGRGRARAPRAKLYCHP